MASLASAAAKRDELQKRLYLLKEQRAREQRIFDELVASNEGLSAQEMSELARERAAAAAPTSMTVKGVEVTVGAMVRVLDDVAVWLRCEGNATVADPLKRVYLGETGRVVRVLPAYHDAQAVELRFADGAEKLFFADCLDVGTPAHTDAADVATATTTVVASSADDERDAATAAVKPTTTMPSHDGNKEDKGSGDGVDEAALPTWQDVLLLRKRPTATTTSTSHNSNSSNEANSNTKDKKDSGSGACLQATTSDDAVAAQNSSSSSSNLVEPVIVPFQRLGLVREALGDNLPLHHNAHGNNNNNNSGGGGGSNASEAARAHTGATADAYDTHNRNGSGHVAHLAASAAVTEELGRPYAMTALTHTTLCATTGSELDNLLTTPRPDLLVLPTSRPLLGGRRLPSTCSRDYVAMYAFDDKTTQIPRLSRDAHAAAVMAARRCWVAGLTPSQTRPLRYTAVLFRTDESNSNNNKEDGSSCTTTTAAARQLGDMAAILQCVTTALGWHTSGLRATRLFTAEGTELMWPEALREGMRLVATTGTTYTPPPPPPSSATSTHAAPAAAVVASPSPLPPQRPAVVAAATATAATTTASAGRTQASQPRGVSMTSTTTSHSNNVTRRVRPALSSAKPIHICVYENGVYDESAYERVSHTITVRPTYKSLRALHSIIERELGWRDGRHVDVLYDASGSVIASLDELFDGAAVVASAGDRFVVPYPNTQLHVAALQLAARRAAAAA